MGIATGDKLGVLGGAGGYAGGLASWETGVAQHYGGQCEGERSHLPTVCVAITFVSALRAAAAPMAHLRFPGLTWGRKGRAWRFPGQGVDDILEGLRDYRRVGSVEP